MSKDNDSSPSNTPRVDGNSRVFGVIAHPIGHVRAPTVFNPRFAKIGINNIMVPIDAPPQALKSIIKGLRNIPNFGGLAVTIPHKLEMAKMCDKLGKNARLTGAVNAIRFEKNGSLYGENFDGVGFVAGCRGNGYELLGKNILVIGAGGAARAIVVALCEAGVKTLTIANRDKSKAINLSEMLYKELGFSMANPKELHETDSSGFDMIINCTSLG